MIRFPRISNFTDFDVLRNIKGVTVRYVTRLSELKTPDMVILPGTKNTIGDLLWLRQNGTLSASVKVVDLGMDEETSAIAQLLERRGMITLESGEKDEGS